MSGTRMKGLKILFVHSGADLYGASRSLLRLSSRLVRDGNILKVVLPYDGPLRQELYKNNVDVLIHRDLPVVTRQRFLRWTGLVSLIASLPVSIIRLTRLVGAFKPDIVHTNTALILSPGIVARYMNVPHVWHVRESLTEFSKFWRWYKWFMHRFSDVIICVSTPIAEQFNDHNLNDKAIILHNGFPQDEFSPVDQERVTKFLQKFQLDGHTLVGVVGRIKFARKGQEVFVQAAALLRARFPQVKFLLIGSPFPGNDEHLDNLKNLVRELELDDQVVYTGDVEDIKAAYAALDISVLPSAMPEPFSGVVIESMAFAKPVVGTRIGGTIEQIEDGVTGFLVEPNDPVALAEALERLLADGTLRRTMGENGRQRFLSRFEFESYYDRMLFLYSNLLTPCKGRGGSLRQTYGNYVSENLN